MKLFHLDAYKETRKYLYLFDSLMKDENINKEYFLKDINEDHFQIKLCGAGGGGFLLGFSDDVEATDRYWEDRRKKISWIR